MDANEHSAVDHFVEAGCPRRVAEEIVRKITVDVGRWGSADARATWRTTAEPGEDDWLSAIEAAVSEAAR